MAITLNSLCRTSRAAERGATAARGPRVPAVYAAHVFAQVVDARERLAADVAERVAALLVHRLLVAPAEPLEREVAAAAVRAREPAATAHGAGRRRPRPCGDGGRGEPERQAGGGGRPLNEGTHLNAASVTHGAGGWCSCCYLKESAIVLVRLGV